MLSAPGRNNGFARAQVPHPAALLDLCLPPEYVGHRPLDLRERALSAPARVDHKECRKAGKEARHAGGLGRNSTPSPWLSDSLRAGGVSGWRASSPAFLPSL